MDYEENVDTEVNEAAADEDFSEEIYEEEEDSSESLDSLMDGEDEGEEEPAEEPEPEQKGTAEPGYVQRRIEKAVARALAAERENIRAEYEQQFAPLKERLLEMDAQDLVRKGVVKDIDTAKELVRYRQGLSPAPQEPAEQPRNTNGQYAPKNDPVMQTKVDMLAAQADKIRERTGLDVIEVFSNDEKIRKAIVNGEMDFYDVAEQMKQSSQPQRRKPPAPTRSSNGASGQTPNAIENMTDEQFARMEKKIREGARYSLR